MTSPPIIVPSAAVPVPDLIPTDGQFVDDAGNPLPFVDPDGVFVTTTTDAIVAGRTTRVGAAAVGCQVGDWVVLANGSKTDEPREVVAAGTGYIAVAEPFGISATGTSTITRSRITPKLSWNLGGYSFGHLEWDGAKKNLTGRVRVDSSVSSVKNGAVTAEIWIGGVVVARKTQEIFGIAGGTCKAALEPFTFGVPFGASGGNLRGKTAYVRAYANMSYPKRCNIRGITMLLGPRRGPNFDIP